MTSRIYNNWGGMNAANLAIYVRQYQLEALVDGQSIMYTKALMVLFENGCLYTDKGEIRLSALNGVIVLFGMDTQILHLAAATFNVSLSFGKAKEKSQIIARIAQAMGRMSDSEIQAKLNNVGRLNGTQFQPSFAAARQHQARIEFQPALAQPQRAPLQLENNGSRLERLGIRAPPMLGNARNPDSGIISSPVLSHANVRNDQSSLLKPDDNAIPMGNPSPDDVDFPSISNDSIGNDFGDNIMMSIAPAVPQNLTQIPGETKLEDMLDNLRISPHQRAINAAREKEEGIRKNIQRCAEMLNASIGLYNAANAKLATANAALKEVQAVNGSLEEIEKARETVYQHSQRVAKVKAGVKQRSANKNALETSLSEVLMELVELEMD